MKPGHSEKKRLDNLWRVADRAFERARRSGRNEDWEIFKAAYQEYVDAKLRNLSRSA